MQQELISGDTLNFATTVSAYPASDGWALKFRLVPRTGSNAAIELTAAAEGDDYRTTASAVVTAGWAADNYTWTSWVEKAGEVYSVENGQITIKPNPRTVAAGHDGRSEAVKALEAVTAMLSGKASSAVESYKINGRELKSYPLPDLIRLQQQLRRDVDAEQTAQAVAAGLNGRKRFVVRM